MSSLESKFAPLGTDHAPGREVRLGAPSAGAALRGDPPPRGRARPADFGLLTLAISATVFLGFWFTYFGPTFAGAYPKVSPLVHLHGWSFFLWYLLLPLQTGLIHFRRLPLHRTLGYASLALALVMVLTGMTVLGVQMQSALAATGFSFWAVAGPAIFSTMLLFAGFYVAALLFRRKPAHHKRLIVVASAAGMGAAVWRVFGAVFGQVMWILPASIVATNFFILVGMVLDLVREGRIHRVYLIGLPVCLGVELGIFLATPTAAGRFLAGGLAWIGGVLGFLY